MGGSFPQSNLSSGLLSYASSIQHGSRQGVAEPLLMFELACSGSHGELKTRCDLSAENRYKGTLLGKLWPEPPYSAING
jgi:hypothetical protein